MNLEKTLSLRKPIQNGEHTYTSLDLREPTAGELEQASKATTNLGVVMNLIAIVAKVPRRVVESLCQRDLKEAGDFLDSFSAGDPTTGETSSPNWSSSTAGARAMRGPSPGPSWTGGTDKHTAS